MVSRKRSLVALTALVAAHALPTFAGAQAKCDAINDGSPFQVAGAKTYLATVQTSNKADEKPKHFANAFRLLTTDPEKLKNENGRQYLLLRLYAEYLNVNPSHYVEKRGTLGMQTNPEGSQNVLMALDSAATYLESQVPACKAVFAPYRQKFFGELINKSIAAMNADKVDSAKFYAANARLLSPNDPRSWNVMTALYNKENKADSALFTMNKVIELSGADPVYKAIRQQARYNIAVMTLGDAEAMQGDAKTQGLAKAKGLLEAYLKDSPDDANAKQALARTLTASGDTTAVAQIFSDMVDHPEKFTSIQLFEAASNAANARRDVEASKLFTNGLAQNPYHRDALFNLANSLFALKDGDRMLPIVQRLLAVDPNNGNAVRLYAGAWQVKAQAEKDAARKKPMSDSILFYLDKERTLNPRVNITSAVPGAKSFDIAGSVENAGTAAGSYTIKFEFLDKDGKAVANKDVTVGPVAPGSNSGFTVKVEAPGAIAYRYAPVK